MHFAVCYNNATWLTEGIEDASDIDPTALSKCPPNGKTPSRVMKQGWPTKPPGDRHLTQWRLVFAGGHPQTPLGLHIAEEGKTGYCQCHRWRLKPPAAFGRKYHIRGLLIPLQSLGRDRVAWMRSYPQLSHVNPGLVASLRH